MCMKVPVSVGQDCPDRVPQTVSNDRHLLPHSSRGWGFQIQVSSGLLFPVASLVGLQLAALCLPCAHTYWGPFSSHKAQPTGLQPPLTASFNPITSLHAPSPCTITGG